MLSHCLSSERKMTRYVEGQKGQKKSRSEERLSWHRGGAYFAALAI
jgi:hypothetical protein